MMETTVVSEISIRPVRTFYMDSRVVQELPTASGQMHVDEEGRLTGESSLGQP